MFRHEEGVAGRRRVNGRSVARQEGMGHGRIVETPCRRFRRTLHKLCNCAPQRTEIARQTDHSRACSSTLNPRRHIIWPVWRTAARPGPRLGHRQLFFGHQLRHRSLDGVITARVKAALLADPGIHSLDIRVVTRIDEVQLSGFVDNQTQIDRAIALTQAVPGVKRVANERAIKK